jgi:hypothetical protein
MAKQVNRLRPSQISDDEDGLAALKGMAGYAPANEAYTVAAIASAHAALQSAWTAETQAEATLAAARDNSVAAEWTLHTLILGAMDQVIAQFGRNSNEVQALKLKKSSERKAPQRKRPGGAGQ